MKREREKVSGQQHRGHHKSDFPQSPAEGPFARPCADTLSGARSIDWRRHADADYAGFGGREGQRGEVGDCWLCMCVLVVVRGWGEGGSWRNLPQHQTKTANQTQENVGVCVCLCVCAGECADSGVISSPISTPSLTSTLAPFFFFPAHHNLLPTHSRANRGVKTSLLLQGLCWEAEIQLTQPEGSCWLKPNPWRRNTNLHQPTCQLDLLECLNRIYVLFNSVQGRRVVMVTLQL